MADFLSNPGIPHLELALLLVSLAALVRGYTGFGFAAIAITGLNLVWPPQLSVPVILLLDLIGTLGLLGAAWPAADKGLIGRFSLGALIGIPLGLTLLIQVPETHLKLGISIGVLLMSLLLMRRPQVSSREHHWLTRTIGGVSGAFTAAASVGGLPVVCYLLTVPLSTAVQRASMVIFLAATDLVALLLLYISGVFDTSLIAPVLVLLIPTILGVQVGQWAFHRRRPQSFHPVALPILTLLSVSGLGMGVYKLF
ncbi:sulfite exporter TauE/SafE family protein [Marinobacterium sp. YM272]|uniref:sulfite exporter TauE/SafE family protein n=1 Tax=Marinobacterium sp. YM272 TaxID=3421654 RepID=UPI003D7FDEA1